MSGQSLREQVIQVVISRLGAAGSPAKKVFRSNTDQISSKDLPCYNVFPGDEDPTVGGDFADRESTERKLDITVQVVVDAATQKTNNSPDMRGVPLDDSVLDPFYVFAIQQMTGNDGRLGGFVNKADEVRHVTVFRPEGRDLIGLEMGFSFEFSTLRGDPTRRG